MSNELKLLHQHPNVVLNEQGFLHLFGQLWIKKLVHENKIHHGTWNIGTLIGKSMKEVDIMIQRRINIMCF